MGHIMNDVLLRYHETRDRDVADGDRLHEAAYDCRIG